MRDLLNDPNDSTVREYAQRVPYLQSLKLMLDADLILVIGSDDPAYVPSRLGACLAAVRPVLGIVRGDSALSDILHKTGYALG